jgi:hypothetical protein
MIKAPSGATSETNEQRRSNIYGWRNMPPRRAWSVGGVLATKMPLLAELGYGINDIRLFYENDGRFLNQF